MTEVLTREPVREQLPERLAQAQAAVALPEVQEMIRKLSAYNLGVMMLHGHDEQTGHFTEFPAGKLQVESDLKVTFEDAESVRARMDEFVEVGWTWQGDAVTGMAMCHMVCAKRGSDTMHYNMHEKNA